LAISLSTPDFCFQALQTASHAMALRRLPESSPRAGCGKSARPVPAFRPAVVGAKEAFEGDADGIARDKVLPHVEGRKASEETRIEWVYLVTEIRTLVEGFAVGVARKQLYSPAGVADAGLQRVVTGIADGRLIADVTEIGTQRPPCLIGVLATGTAPGYAEAQAGLPGFAGSSTGR
jgi:hypothetical protein